MKQTRKMTLVLIAMMGTSGFLQAAVTRRENDAALSNILGVDQRPVATAVSGGGDEDSAVADEMAAKKKKKPKPKKKPKGKAS